MKLGFVIPSVGPAVNSAAGLSAFCRALEDLGHDTLWVADRLVTPVDMQATYPGKEQPYPPQMTRNLDPVLLWTVAATATSRVRLNASTLNTFYYEPTHLARQLTTLDVLSDGCLDVGVGVGWMKDELDIARGADWHQRGRMLDDLLAFLHQWWTTTPVSCSRACASASGTPTGRRRRSATPPRPMSPSTSETSRPRPTPPPRRDRQRTPRRCSRTAAPSPQWSTPNRASMAWLTPELYRRDRRWRRARVGPARRARRGRQPAQQAQARRDARESGPGESDIFRTRPPARASVSDARSREAGSDSSVSNTHFLGTA